MCTYNVQVSSPEESDEHASANGGKYSKVPGPTLYSVKIVNPNNTANN